MAGVKWTPQQIKMVLAKPMQPKAPTSSAPRFGTVSGMAKTGYGKK